MTACRDTDFSQTTYRTAKSGFSGAVFDGGLVISAEIHDLDISENNVNGLLMSNTGGRHKIYNLKCNSNFTGSGMLLDSIDNSDIKNCYLEANGANGALIDSSENVSYQNNRSRSNSNNGHVISINNSEITGNRSSDDGQGADNTYSGIVLTGSASSNNVQMNQVRTDVTAISLQYGISLDNPQCQNNIVTNNDLRSSGQTSSLFDNGSGTITSAGNQT